MSSAEMLTQHAKHLKMLSADVMTGSVRFNKDRQYQKFFFCYQGNWD